MPVIIVDHPLAQHLLAGLRDRDTPPSMFRLMTRRLTMILITRATEGLPTREVPINTRLEGTTGRILDNRIVAVPILRAGLGMLDGVLEMIPDVDVGYIGIERTLDTFEPKDYYRKLPPIMGRHVFLLDPMLATGGSASVALEELASGKPESLTLVSIVAAPEGLSVIEEKFPGVGVYLAAVDRELSPDALILPGLGDFGDRLFGT